MKHLLTFAKAYIAKNDSRLDNDNVASGCSSPVQNVARSARPDRGSYLQQGPADYYRTTSLPSNADAKGNRQCTPRCGIDPSRCNAVDVQESSSIPVRLTSGRNRPRSQKRSSNPFPENLLTATQSGCRSQE